MPYRTSVQREKGITSVPRNFLIIPRTGDSDAPTADLDYSTMYKKYAVTSIGFCMNHGHIPAGQTSKHMIPPTFYPKPSLHPKPSLYLPSAEITFKYASRSKFLSSGSRMTVRILLALLKLMRELYFQFSIPMLF
jgi:hypothetical protein